MMVINELLRNSPSFAANLTVWIGLPSEFHHSCAPHFELLQEGVSIRLFEAEPAQHDPYFVKVGLAGLVEKLSADDEFLYLDYDHLVRGPIRLDACRQEGILVSSEVKELCASVSLWHDDFVELAPHAGQKHFNNSLIFTSISSMQAMAGPWRSHYHKLTCLPPEMREEVAFCLAAETVGKPLIAAPHHLQEHFREGSRDSVLFHYGGAHDGARHLKQFLKERAGAFLWQDFTSDCLHREHRMLQAQLARFCTLS